jgi:hypothetical protein
MTMTGLLFQLSFVLAAPFWALMILAPTWRWTQRVIASPLIILPSLVVCIVLYAQVLPDLWPVVSNPTLDGLQQLVASPEALAGLWAQIIAWDLLVGRWIYLDSRQRAIWPLLMAPVLVLAILLSPFAYPLYLLARIVFPARAPESPEAIDRPAETSAVR